MSDSKRVFVLGAGFSKLAGMPLATELLPLLVKRARCDEMRGWLDSLSERLAWISGCDEQTDSLSLNIEQVFHYAHFDIEVHRLRQHLESVGRGDGPGTSWKQAEAIGAWLSYLEEDLRDVILECDDASDLSPISRWAKHLGERDGVLSFNYDTLAERAIVEQGEAWNHGTDLDGGKGIPVHKLHGSIDWIVAHRSESFHKLDLIFDKQNSNRRDGETGHVEDDCCLWRCTQRDQLRKWVEDRDLQHIPDEATCSTIGIAGLGAYKELHRIPGLGEIWVNGMQSLYQADLAIVVGFAMSDFDAMAQMQFADVAQARQREDRPLQVIVIDPFADEAAKNRFRRVFRNVEFVDKKHEDFDWSSLPGGNCADATGSVHA